MYLYIILKKNRRPKMNPDKTIIQNTSTTKKYFEKKAAYDILQSYNTYVSNNKQSLAKQYLSIHYLKL